VAMEHKMKPFDKILEALPLDVLTELEDIYNIWSWHPGMG